MKLAPAEIGRLLQNGLGLHKQGQLDQAESLYRQALERDPANFTALQLLGLLRGQQGRVIEAITLIEGALKIHPNDVGALSNYGLALAAVGRHGDAVASYDRALAIKPDFFQALYNRGVALASLKRFDEAVTGFGEALSVRPGSIECFYNQALALSALGKPEMALDSYDKALFHNPRLAEALDNRGNVLRELGRLDEALDSYNKTLTLSPRSFSALYNRGVVLSDLERPEEALASYDAALAIKPDFPEAWFNRGISLIGLKHFGEALASLDRGLALRPGDAKALGDSAVALHRLERREEALACCNQALERDPDHVPTLMTRGLLLQELTRFAEALTDYERVLGIDPNHALAWNDRGAMLHAANRADEALTCFDRAVGIKPDMAEALVGRAYLRWMLRGDYTAAVRDLTEAISLDPHQPYARGALLHMKMQVADWEDFDREIALIDIGVRAGHRVVRPFVYQALSESPADLQACSRIFAPNLSPNKPDSFPYGRRDRHRKIKLGYVSGEFREQATAYLMAGLYERHDHDKFEIFGVDSGGPNVSAMRKRLDAAFDNIIDISKLPDGEAADRIHAAEIDILVNLNGYFGAARTGVFARRPAPLQVNYLGFPATLGATYMDYIIADPIVIPKGERRFYDERVVWLPHSYQANDFKRPIAENAPSRAALGLPQDAFVFCNFNQSYKLTPQIFGSWMRILRGTEDSVLWLLESKPPFAENVIGAAERHGVARERLIFARSISADQHLARLKRADLFLDTLPYNAHTTASDALWAGLPLLTCRGSAFPGRVATSLLHAVGLPELVTDDLEQYEALALKLARDSSFHQSIKQKLARNRLTTPLFDTDKFRLDIEAAYTQMWEIAERGGAPRGFAVGQDA